MSRRKIISQRAARELQRRVHELERQEIERHSAFRRDYPGGVHMASIDLSSDSYAAGKLQAAQMLGAALVGRIESKMLRVYAILPAHRPET